MQILQTILPVHLGNRLHFNHIIVITIHYAQSSNSVVFGFQNILKQATLVFKIN